MTEHDRKKLERELRELRSREATICRSLNGEPPKTMKVVVPNFCVVHYEVIA